MISGSAFTATDESLLPILDELQRREPIFHRPGVARTPGDFEEMLAPDYWEVGASGRRYSAAFILQTLAETPPVDADIAGWHSYGFACRRLGPAIFLLTYTLEQGARRTRRATVWERFEDRWRILYHQGTVISCEEDDPQATGT